MVKKVPNSQPPLLGSFSCTITIWILSAPPLAGQGLSFAWSDACSGNDVDQDFRDWCVKDPVASDCNRFNDQVLLEFKFTIDDTWEVLQPGDECTVTVDEFTNRYVEVTGPTKVASSAPGSCSGCD